jgi:hypothetical protein
MALPGTACLEHETDSAPVSFLLLLAPVLKPFKPLKAVSLTGDKCVVLHWDPVLAGNLAGYRVYRSRTGAGGPSRFRRAVLALAS